MELSQLLEQLLIQLPNMGIAIWMLWTQDKKIDGLLTNQQQLIDKLLAYVDKDKQAAQKVLSDANQKVQN